MAKLEEDDIIKDNTDFLVTETVLDHSLPLQDIVEILRRRKTTGMLTFYLSQGGFLKVWLTEKTKVDNGHEEKIRKILGWS